MDHALYVFATLFIAMSFNADAASRRQMAMRGTAAGAGVLLIFALAGETLLNALGISILVPDHRLDKSGVPPPE